MSYISPTALLDSPGAEILGQVAAPLDRARVSGELMRLTIEGGDRSAFTAEEQTAADEALENIDSVISEVGGIVDGYLASRYDLPLDPIPKILQAYARDLVVERLYRDGGPEAVMKRGQSAIRFLEKIAAGNITLGAGDTTHGSADVRTTRTDSDRTHTKDSLSDFGAGQ